jgi:hypothetical protein
MERMQAFFDAVGSQGERVLLDGPCLLPKALRDPSVPQTMLKRGEALIYVTVDENEETTRLWGKRAMESSEPCRPVIQHTSPVDAMLLLDCSITGMNNTRPLLYESVGSSKIKAPNRAPPGVKATVNELSKSPESLSKEGILSFGTDSLHIERPRSEKPAFKALIEQLLEHRDYDTQVEQSGFVHGDPLDILHHLLQKLETCYAHRYGDYIQENEHRIESDLIYLLRPIAWKIFQSKQYNYKR